MPIFNLVWYHVENCFFITLYVMCLTVTLIIGKETHAMSTHDMK